MRPHITALNLLRTVEHKQFVTPDASAAASTFIAQYHSLGTANSARDEVQLFLTEFIMLVSRALCQRSWFELDRQRCMAKHPYCTAQVLRALNMSS